VDTARIAALLDSFLLQPLPDAALDQISTYIDLLRRWNARINLTAVRDPEAIVTRHFGESLFLARHLFPEGVARTFLSAQRVSASQEVGAPLIAHSAMSGTPSPNLPHVLDIGSGAGFPGLPVKIWAPAIRLTLVESNHKKAAFLREVARAVTLTDVDVMTERAETLRLPPAQVVTLRAVERFETILSLVTRFLAPAGRLALLIGSSQAHLLPTLVPHLKWLPPIPVPQSKSKILAITSRVSN
jgi:16S rRNA (guanine527-N7)-methyltransferase